MNGGRKLSLGVSTSLAVLACTAFDVALHRLGGWVFDFDYFQNGLPTSALVKAGVFPIAASVGFGVLFGTLAVFFLRSRAELGGDARRASLRFFVPLALVMLLGVLESAVVFPTPFKAELVTAIADAVPFLLLGALLSRLGDRSRAASAGGAPRRAGWPSMPWVALSVVAGRYLVSYPVLRITSGYLDRPAGTLVWTAACGLAMGAFYWLSGSAFSAATPARRALRAGLLPLGVFWLMVQLFYALIFAVSVADLALRGAADGVYLVAGIYGYERLFRSADRPSRSAARTRAAAPGIYPG